MRPILFYNSWCPFCRWAASIIARMDKEIAILPYSDAKALIFFHSFNIGLKERYATWWIYMTAHPGNGFFYQQSPWRMWAGNKGGWIALLCAVHRTRRLGRVLWRLKLSWFLDKMDNLISWSRPLLKKFVPDVKPVRRYE
jgi:hypothetical protein